MNMFQADVKSQWTYDHCWEVLKYCDKWMIISQSNLRAPSLVYEETNETHVSLDSDQDPYSNATVSSPRKRPPGRKAAKESRQKSKASPTDTVTPQIFGGHIFFFFFTRVQCTSLLHTQNI